MRIPILDGWRGFSIQMAGALVVMALVSFFGCLVTSTSVPGIGWETAGLVYIGIAVLPGLLYLDESGRFYLVETSVTLLWCGLAQLLLGFLVTAVARLGMVNGLQDATFVRLDQSLGVNVPGIELWSGHHLAGRLVSYSYDLLTPYMKLAVVLPILTGRVKSVQRFLLANLVAFGIALPLYLLFPAVGPWYGYHFAGRPDQMACQNLFLIIRQSGHYAYRNPDGIICFPSFHVIWAVLCAQAFWDLKALRIPAAVLAGAIVLSTMTIGNHYFCDVLAGLVVAGVAVAVSSHPTICPRRNRPTEPAAKEVEGVHGLLPRTLVPTMSFQRIFCSSKLAAKQLSISPRSLDCLIAALLIAARRVRIKVLVPH